jgi:hypothetical protein
MEEGAESGQEGQTGPSDIALPPDTVDLGPDPGDRRQVALTAAPFAAVVVVGLWLTRAFWWPGSYVVGFDTYAYSGPNLEVTERALRAGRLPIINDMIFAGVPHLGNPSAVSLYPPQLLTLPFDTNRSMGLLVAAHVLLLGIGMVVLARRLGVGRLGATAGAVAAMAAGATLTKTVQFEQILVVGWIPMLLASIHAALTGLRPGRGVAALAATTGAVLLAGHPQLVYQTVLLALAATAGFAWDDGRVRRLGHVAAGAALGACLALPQLVAVLAATADSAITAGRDIDDLLAPALSLDPRATVRAVLGTVQDRDQVAFAGGFESIGFIGVAVTLLAVVGLVQTLSDRRSRSWAVALAATALISLVWAWGPRTAVFRIAFEFLPGFDLARASARWIIVVAVIAALFAGAGVDALWGAVRRRHAAGAAGAALAVVALVGLDVADIADRRSALIWVLTAAFVLTLVGVGLARPHDRAFPVVAIIAVAAAELALMSLHSLPQSLATDIPFTGHRTATTDFLADAGSGFVVALTDDGAPVPYAVPAMRPNANVLAGVASIDGYDGGVQITGRWADALRRFQADPPTDLPLRNSLSLPVEPDALARLGVRWVLIDRDRAPEVFIPGWDGPVATDADFQVWENPSWLGDATVWPAAIASEDPAALLREQPATAAGAAIVSGAGSTVTCTRIAPACEPSGVPVVRPRPERIELTVELDDPAVVSISQQALPGWNVEVDGEPAALVVVDGLFAGVRLPEGRHDVAFEYRSPFLGSTLVIAALALIATVVLAVSGAMPDPKRRRAQEAGTRDR